MPGVTKYNLVDDAHDLRIPMHNDEVFKHGVCFEAKYVGSLEVGRPSSRMEIVAAMRRIRYEFKLKNIKKKKVNIVVSTDSIRVILRKKRKVSSSQRKGWSWDEDAVVVTQDPISRIFYVSHDAQDLKIFSYIAREGQSSVFRCNVFKSKRKSQAMRIVRTVGQAFDVCHQLTLQQQSDEKSLEVSQRRSAAGKHAEESALLHLGAASGCNVETQESPDESAFKAPLGGNLHQFHLFMKSTTLPSPALPMRAESPPLLLNSPIFGAPAEASSSEEHQIQLLRKQLQQQEQQALAASAQVHVLQEQLSVEAKARNDAQVRVQRLLQQNTDLLQHISLLVKQIQELEIKANGSFTSMGSQDSLLEITFRARPPSAPCEPLPSSSCTRSLTIQSLNPVSDGPWEPTLLQSSVLGRSGVRLECFRFSTREEPGQDAVGEQVLGALELLRFRESGIGSEYESNTDESDDRDSWGQAEAADSSARLLNVLNPETLPDCLGEEMAV
uniref:Carboxyl-terminal PDZ ligand of neuronal nitric oxide synthase protein n=1 Tax=Tetraodon nigroviridis TaxID=99883 RepID=H3CNA4_TETNG